MIGSEVTSARRKSSSNDSPSCLLALASPNSSIRNSGCASLEGRDGLQRGLDQVLGRDVALLAGVRDLEGDQRRAAVLRDHPLAARRSRGSRRRPRCRSTRAWRRRRRPPRGTPRSSAVTPAVRALDQDGLVRVLGERVRDRVVGLARLADALVLVLDRLGADGAADDHREHDERQPSDDRLPGGGWRSSVRRARRDSCCVPSEHPRVGTPLPASSPNGRPAATSPWPSPRSRPGPPPRPGRSAGRRACGWLRRSSRRRAERRLAPPRPPAPPARRGRARTPPASARRSR